ncbi:unnamed protein product [Staurois parvus]|uniref:Uncharacterized protein n=1 Tax=Staurois parvus TaxID=386267 RepID=A0ABN9E6X3_9NEOB|nr:unnamed protein product [Staurois parvus]
MGGKAPAGHQNHLQERPSHQKSPEASPLQAWHCSSPRDMMLPEIHRAAHLQVALPTPCPGLQDQPVIPELRHHGSAGSL